MRINVIPLKTIIMAVALCFTNAALAGEKLAQEIEGYKITFKIPKGYERIELSERYNEDELEGLGENSTAIYQSEYSRAAVVKKLGATEYPRDEDEWAHGAQLIIISMVMMTKDEANGREDASKFAIISSQATPRLVHDDICANFNATWGQYTFDLFDEKTNIGHCINWVGAFVAMTTYQEGDVLIVVGAADSIGIDLAYEKADEIDDLQALSTKEKWALFRKAANTDDAYKLIRSVKIKAP